MGFNLGVEGSAAFGVRSVRGFCSYSLRSLALNPKPESLNPKPYQTLNVWVCLSERCRWKMTCIPIGSLVVPFWLRV